MKLLRKLKYYVPLLLAIVILAFLTVPNEQQNRKSTTQQNENNAVPSYHVKVGMAALALRNTYDTFHDMPHSFEKGFAAHIDGPLHFTYPTNFAITFEDAHRLTVGCEDGLVSYLTVDIAHIRNDQTKAFELLALWESRLNQLFERTQIPGFTKRSKQEIRQLINSTPLDMMGSGIEQWTDGSAYFQLGITAIHERDDDKKSTRYYISFSAK